MSNKLGILFMLVALGFLYPGISEPIFSLTGTVDKAALAELGIQSLAEDPNIPAFMVSISQQLIQHLDIQGELQAFSKTRSILGTVDELYHARQFLVAFLTALFSIMIPVSKCLLMLVSAIAKNGGAADVSEKIIRLISKWSMADVFVIAIIVAYLAANATQQTEEIFSLTAEFSSGFYYFLAYCIFSILSLQLMDKAAPHSVQIQAPR